MTKKQQTDQLDSNSHGIEFFHIYTDEKISAVHDASIRYLEDSKKAWQFDYHLIMLVDNYNPLVHTLTTKQIFAYLEKNETLPDFWAYEGDLVQNAKLLLESLTSDKLKKSYQRYIEKNNKYPCSLLTAAWYLTRLGMLPPENIIRAVSGNSYTPPARLLNILPQYYEGVELRAEKLIKNSQFSCAVDKIQEVFLSVSSDTKAALW